jgi:hypothetical protein
MESTSVGDSAIAADVLALTAMTLDPVVSAQPFTLGVHVPAIELATSPTTLKSRTHFSVKGFGLSPSSVHGNLSSRPSREDLIAYGGILDPVLSSPRSSDCLRAQPNVDLPQMERAMSLDQRKDESVGILHKSKSKLSFVSFSDNKIVEKVGRLGVSLGDSLDKVPTSVKVIKNLEIECKVTFLKNNLESLSTNDSQSLVMSRATNLSEDRWMMLMIEMWNVLAI